MTLTRVLCVAAVVGLFAASATTASAINPEFTTKAVVTTPIPFEATLAASFFEAKPSKTKVTCTGGIGIGEVTAPKVAQNILLLMTGCETSGLKCKTVGLGEGEIHPVASEGQLDDITHNVLPGLRLYPTTPPVWAEFECGGGVAKVVIKGSVIGSLTPASGLTIAENVIPTALKWSFKAYTKYWNSGAFPFEQTINNGAPEALSWSMNIRIKSIPGSNLGVTK